jgi:hypothetical protein
MRVVLLVATFVALWGCFLIALLMVEGANWISTQICQP